MITYFTSNDNNDICDSLIELWENDCKNEEEKSMKIFHKKKERCVYIYVCIYIYITCIQIDRQIDIDRDICVYMYVYI